MRVLADNNDLHTPAGHIAVGWLVVEDLFTVVALVLLPALFGPATTGAPLWLALALTALKVAALVAFTAVVGTRVIPRLLDYVAQHAIARAVHADGAGDCLGIAVGSSLIFSVSMALGAFLAGMVVGRSDYSLRAASDALPMRDAFAVLFFVSVGMLLDPGAPDRGPAWSLGALAVVLRRQAARRAGDRLGDAVSVQGRADGGDRAGADRRVLVHPRDDRPGARHPHDGGDQRARRRVDRVDRAQSAAVPRDRPGGAVARRPGRGSGALLESGAHRRPPTTARRLARAADPRHRAVVIGYGPTGRTWCGCCGRTASSRRWSSSTWTPCARCARRASMPSTAMRPDPRRSTGRRRRPRAA